MGEFSDLDAYKKLEQQLSSFGNPQLRHNLLFYLATSPSQFGGGGGAVARRRAFCTRTAARAGSASWWKSRSATTSPRRTS